MRLKGRTIEGWAVFNHMGSLWTSRVFTEEAHAVTFLEESRREWREKGYGDGLSGHRVAPVKAVVTPVDLQKKGVFGPDGPTLTRIDYEALRASQEGKDANGT